MHLSLWAAADPRFPIPHLLEKYAPKRGQVVRGAERRAMGACAWSLRGRCLQVGAHQVCVGQSWRVCPPPLCAGRGCRKRFGARAAPHRRSRPPEQGGMRAGTFRPPRKSGSWRSVGLSPAAGPECPPRPHFRLPPLPRSRLPGPPVPREPRRHSPTRPALLAPTPPPPLVGSASSEPAGCGRCSTYGRINNYLAPDLSSAAPGGQSLQGGADMDPNPRAALERQQLRLRERQKFFEDILQPETEFVFPLSHLHLESQRPPIGSISSMEVNVDTLEQVEFIDLADQDGADVFLPCEDSPPTPQMSGMDSRPEGLSLPVPTPDRTTSRTSSLSSDSSNLRSPNPSDGGADTPLAQSDEEDGDDGGAEPGPCS